MGVRRPAVPLFTSSAPSGGYGWLAYAPAAIAAAIGLAQSFFERMPASWAFAGTDLAQHMILVQDVQRSGSLDYSTTGYPRAFHMLAAFVSVPSPPLDHPVELLSYDMRLVAAATWLSLALVLWAGITLALRLGAARRVPRLVTVGAAVLFGAGVLLTNSFVVTFVYMGAAASLLAVVVIFALPLAALGLDTRSPRDGCHFPRWPHECHVARTPVAATHRGAAPRVRCLRCTRAAHGLAIPCWSRSGVDSSGRSVSCWLRRWSCSRSDPCHC